MTTTLATIDVAVPTDRRPPVNGAEATVQTTAKLLPPSPVRPHPGDELDIEVSDETAAELAVGDVIAVPASAGSPRPFTVIDAPRDGWTRVRPARDKHTLAAALAEENGRVADRKRRAQRAGAARDIFSSRRIFPRSGDYVYATEIEPYDRSQSALRAHLGVPRRRGVRRDLRRGR